MLNISYFIYQIPENKRKVVKKIIYIERLGKRPYNPSTAVFYPPVSVLAFELQIYGRRSTAVPVKRTVRSPTLRLRRGYFD